MAGDERRPMANITPFGLRMQPDLKARIEEAARANNRSLNAEIVDRLEASLDPKSMMVLIDAYEDKLREAIEVNRYLEELKVIHEQRLEEMDDVKSEVAQPEEPIFNIVLDAKGHPISWPEIAAHIYRTAKAAGLESVGFRAAIFNAERPINDRDLEYSRLIRWYQQQTKKHKHEIRGGNATNSPQVDV